MSRVHTDANVFDYFRAQVREARNQADVDLTEHTELYLAQLLADRTRRPDDGDDQPVTLAELHLQATQGTPAEQASRYRALGDRALYDLGYWPEVVERRVVGPSYYAEMGSAAYARTDLVFKRFFADAFGPLFRELAERFRACVGVLERVRASADGEDELTRLYNEWVESGSETLADRLRMRGLVVPRRRVDA
jgi:hypothetical protein